MMSLDDASAPQTCHLCGKSGNDSLLGDLVTVNTLITVHVGCMVYSSDVWVRSESDEAMYIRCGGTFKYNKDYRVKTLGFKDAIARSQLCYTCNAPHASLKCARVGCNKSFHLPCTLAAKGNSFIFHAKMVFYALEELSNGSVKGVLRPGRFCVCRHHADWDRSPIWGCLRSYITERPTLLNAVSIDVDALPQNLQIIVSKASQMSIFNPEKNKQSPKSTEHRDVGDTNDFLSFTDVDGGVLELPRKNWIRWDCPNSTWEVGLKPAKPQTPTKKSDPELKDSVIIIDDDKAAASSTASSTSAQEQKSAASTKRKKPASGDITTEQMLVPSALTNFVSQKFFIQILTKVKDEAKVISVALSTGLDSSEVFVNITSNTVESGAVARRIVENRFKQGISIIERESAAHQSTDKAEKVVEQIGAPKKEPSIAAPPMEKSFTSTSSSSTSSGRVNNESSTSTVAEPDTSSSISCVTAIENMKATSSNSSSRGLSTLKKTISVDTKRNATKEDDTPVFCGTCSGSAETKILGKMLVCSLCDISVHSNCTDGYGSLSNEGAWQCASCQDKKATQCCFCETKSTQLFRRPTYPNCFSWVHTVCLHANSVGSKTGDSKKRKKVKKKDDSDDSDSDNDDGSKCVVCVDDEFKRVDLQRKDCNVSFHMSCAWLAGHKMVRVEQSQKAAGAGADLYLPILYRLNAYCEGHSGVLIKREKSDSIMVSDIVSKESWRESNAYRKDKPAPIPTREVDLESGGSDSDVPMDTHLVDSEDESEESVPVVKSKVLKAGAAVSKTTAKPDRKGRLVGKGSRGPYKLKDGSSVYSKQGDDGKEPALKTKGYREIAAASEAAAAAAAQRAAESRLAEAAISKRSPSYVGYGGDSNVSTARAPLKNPEKQEEFRAARLKKKMAEAEEKQQIEAVKIAAFKEESERHMLTDALTKAKIKSRRLNQPGSTVMTQRFGSLKEEVFTNVFQLWGSDRSLVERWDKSEALPELYWEYMVSEDAFYSRGFNLVINASTINNIQVFGLDPLEKESAGSKLLRTIVDSSYAIFCGQVPLLKVDVIVIVHCDAASGKIIGKQLTAMNVHHESSYYLVAFSKNALLTPEPFTAPLPTPTPTPPPPSVISISPRNKVTSQTYDTTQPFVREGDLQRLAQLMAPPDARVAEQKYPEGFHPDLTHQYLTAIAKESTSTNTVKEPKRNYRHEKEIEKKDKKSDSKHNEKDRSRKSSPPPPTSRYGHGPESYAPRSHGGSSNGSSPRGDPGPEKSFKDHTGKDKDYREDSSSLKRKGTYHDEEGRVDRFRRSSDHSKENSRESSREHSWDHSREPSKEPREHSRDSREHSLEHFRESSGDHYRDREHSRANDHFRETSKDGFRDHPNSSSVDLQRDRDSSRHPGDTRAICHFFEKGKCTYGDKCFRFHSRACDERNGVNFRGPDERKVTTAPKNAVQCDICGHTNHPTNICNSTHPQRNHSFSASGIPWAQSGHGKKWTSLGYTCTQKGINSVQMLAERDNSGHQERYEKKQKKYQGTKDKY